MVNLAIKSVGKKRPHPVAQIWSFFHSFKSKRDILPCPQSLQLQTKTRNILHKLLQLLWHRSPFGPDFFPFFFLPPTPLADVPFTLSLSPNTLFVLLFPIFSILNTLSSLLNPLSSKGKCRNPILLFHVWLHYCITEVKHTQSTLDFKQVSSFTAANPFCLS